MTDLLAASPAAPETAPDGAIRPFTAADAPGVARLLLWAFQHRDAAPPAGMTAYLRRVYLEAPGYDPDIGARVAVDGAGVIVGFAGVMAQRLVADGRPLRAAFCSSLAADDRMGDPTVAARLWRHVHAGPQDVSLSDRANAASTRLARALRTEIVRDYSLDWLRVLRPAGLALAGAAARFRPLGLLAPLAAPLDRAMLRRATDAGEPHWTAPPRLVQAAGLGDRTTGAEELADLIPQLLEHYPLRPDWSRDELEFLLADAAQKRTLGDFVARVVTASGGRPLGLFLYHLRRGGIAHVLQLLAAPGREGVVIDRAIAHALARGAVAMRGRALPVQLPALLERRVVLLPELATLLRTRDAAVRQHFAAGTAFFTGLAGEYWMRLNGDRFE